MNGCSRCLSLRCGRWSARPSSAAGSSASGVESRGEPNVGGAVVGGIIGGVLGHQIGSGRGNDAATVGGALAGAAIGSNAGRDGPAYGRDVQRCASVPSGPPQYWDVTYSFRGQEHRVQMQAPPGRTVMVNGNGEPRG